MIGHRLPRLALPLLAGVMFQACAGFGPAPDPASPFFTIEPDALKRYQSLARNREARMETCRNDRACAQLHYTLGLVALFEDGTVAADHFHQVVSLAPDGRIAQSSDSWITLMEHANQPTGWNQFLDSLRKPPGGEALYSASAEQLVRDLLEREIRIIWLARGQARAKASAQALRRALRAREREVQYLKAEGEPGDTGEPSIRKLQRELAIRDRKIDELNSQLEALKRIDHEMREKTRSSRPAPLPVAP